MGLASASLPTPGRRKHITCDPCPAPSSGRIPAQRVLGEEDGTACNIVHTTDACAIITFVKHTQDFGSEDKVEAEAGTAGLHSSSRPSVATINEFSKWGLHRPPSLQRKLQSAWFCLSAFISVGMMLSGLSCPSGHHKSQHGTDFTACQDNDLAHREEPIPAGRQESISDSTPKRNTL